MEPMSPGEIAAIESEAEAARPGPWRLDRGGPDETCEVISEDNRVVCELPYYGEFRHKGDEEFIVNAREHVPRLVAEVRRLTAEADTLRRWTEDAAAAENANAAELVAAREERDEARKALAGVVADLRKRAVQADHDYHHASTTGEASDFLGAGRALTEAADDYDTGLPSLDALLDKARGEGREEMRAAIVGPDDARWKSVFGLDLTFKGKVGDYARRVRDAAKALVVPARASGEVERG